VRSNLHKSNPQKSFIMRKATSILLSLSLLSCLSLNLLSQSSDEKLDQAELFKQFIGTWEADNGKDSVVIIKCIPSNNGIHFVQEDKANGITYSTYQGLLGLSDDKEMIIATAIALNGTMIMDFGKFVEKNKYVVDRYFGNTTHVAMLMEWEFSTPESFVIRTKWRGNGMTFPEDWSPWFTFNKIN
jgi:hypothetical protein